MQGISGAKANSVTPAMPVEAPAAQGPGGAGGLLSTQKDAKDSSTEAKFGEVWQNVQSRYGAKQEKPREIKKTLGKDDFLKIMITQMKNQDPTNPFKAEQMATEIAQFTNVEQLQNLNQQMGKLVNANQPLERLALTNMIGKTVTIDRERFTHTENEASPMSYQLEKDAKNVKINILSESGEAVATKDLGPVKAGGQNFNWDGVKSNSMPAKSGHYLFRVEARDASDRLIPMNTRGQAKVAGVSFEGNEGVLLVGDINNPQKVTMKNVVRVDSNAGESPMIPGAQSLKASLGASGGAPNVPSPEAAPSDSAAVAAPNAGVGGKFFTFEKGVGSRPVEGGMTPEAMKALQSYETARASASANSTDDVEKSADGKNNSAPGFPNGISSGDNE